MTADPGERRSILLSLALVAAGIATAAYQMPRQAAMAAEAEQRRRAVPAAHQEVIEDGKDIIDGMTVDARGTLYVSSRRDERVYVMRADGRRSEFIREVVRSDDPLKRINLIIPHALSADGQGNIYVADTSNDDHGCIRYPRIKKFTPDGKVTRLAHADAAMEYQSITDQYIHIAAIASDGAGQLYVQDDDNTYKISGTGKRIRLPIPGNARMHAYAPGTLAQKRGMAAHPDGGVVVTDSRHGVYRITPDERAVPVATHGGDCSLAAPESPDDSRCAGGAHTACRANVDATRAVSCKISAVAVDAHGRIFLTDNTRILQVDTDGKMSTYFRFDKAGLLPRQNPAVRHDLTEMALGPRGEIYVANDMTIYKITPGRSSRRR
ncbi:hypothetical protein F2P44_24415 [Massilia sp. CCM 8695]|uniref:SMP-30/Gluconolactonase/LRE-like region domain-containing protein n=1 Tax=Massilia frigida TaxID=2609281 RepID=A0ABX0NH96_9BURK|nr:hypothetical protein [Massilia frigida]NHZ82402.1 hypothetical protein [Massilia frigida]